MKRLLITGGSGFIGSHFHRCLDNERIVNLDQVEPSFPSTSIHAKGDVRDFESIDEALTQFPCDTILCLAAEHKDFGVARDDYFRTNEYGTQMIVKAAEKHGIKRIIFYSSVAVYGDTSGLSTEETPINPASPYGASKWAGEVVLNEWAAADSSRSVLIIRPTVIYGVRNVANMYRLIEQVDKGRYVNVGAATNIKSIGYVDNLVDATLYLMDRMHPGVQVFNFSDEPQMTSGQIGRTIASALGKRRPATLPYWLVMLMGSPFDLLIKLTGRDLPISTARIKKLCVETHHGAGKLKEAGFKARFSNEDGIRAMVNWYVGEKQSR